MKFYYKYSLLSLVGLAILFSPALNAFAGHPRAKDSVVIHVRVFPSMAEAIPLKTPWNVQAELIVWSGNNGRTGGTQSSVANNQGEATFVLPVDRGYADARVVYRIRVLGGWAYTDAFGEEVSASTPGEHSVSVRVSRK